MSSQNRELILDWYQQALNAVDPVLVTRTALAELDRGEGRLVVVAIGKAAGAMAAAAHDVLGDAISAGLIVTKSGQLTDEVDGFSAMEAAHPIPNESSLLAGERVLAAVSDLSADDTVIALISGGGSSLVEHPVDGVSLMDVQVTTELLMYAGAGIYDLNSVRKSLSAIKGGGLRRAIGDARCITLMLSDVLGNDFSVIASGPTIMEPISRHRAWQVLIDFRIEDRVPASVRQILTTDAPTAIDIDTRRDVCQVLADNTTFVTAIESAALAAGCRPQRVWTNWQADGQELARRMVTDCRSAGVDVDVLLGGGEATSTVRGSGRGGRNTETALVAAMLLEPDDQWTVASLASDGDDGNSGAAGAIVDGETVQDRDRAEATLASSDSAGYLASVNALVAPGPTGTNVNDVYIAVRNRPAGEAR